MTLKSLLLMLLRYSEGISFSNRPMVLHTNSGKVQGKRLKDLSFSILQATEARITETGYISCPTCGRTKFNLQKQSESQDCNRHLKGLKIAIMGCIVNGPGEMAGADYGYVGAAKARCIFTGGWSWY